MIAENEIKAGTRILEDELLVSITDYGIDRNTGERMGVSFESLSSEQQQQFWESHCPDLPTYTPLMRRCLASSFDVDPERSGIFLKASCVNHSCCPNAFPSWNLNLRRLTLHAVVDIPRGEEITVSYCTPFYPIEDRHNWLREHYGFECDCPACRLETASGQYGEQHHQKLKNLYQAINKSKDSVSDNDEQELDMITEFIDLAEDSHMHGLFLSRMYRRAKDCYEDKGLEQLVLIYAQRALEYDMRLLGTDNPVTHESMRALGELKARAPNIK